METIGFRVHNNPWDREGPVTSVKICTECKFIEFYTYEQSAGYRFTNFNTLKIEDYNIPKVCPRCNKTLV